MFVRFRSDQITGGSGFYARYSTKPAGKQQELYTTHASLISPLPILFFFKCLQRVVANLFPTEAI